MLSFFLMQWHLWKLPVLLPRETTTPSLTMSLVSKSYCPAVPVAIFFSYGHFKYIVATCLLLFSSFCLRLRVMMGTPPKSLWPIVLVSHVSIVTCLRIDTGCLYEQHLDSAELCLFVFSTKDSRSMVVFGFAVMGESCVYMQWCVFLCLCVPR